MSDAKRLTELERWRDRADGLHPAGVPGRIHDLETVLTEIRGAVKTFRVVAALVGLAVALLTLSEVLRGPV